MLEEAYLTHIFLVKYITAFLYLRIIDSNLVLCLGVILNSKITNRKRKNVEKIHLKIMRSTLVYSVKLKQEGVTCWEWGLGATQTFCCSAACPQMTMETPWVLIWGFGINFSW